MSDTTSSAPSLHLRFPKSLKNVPTHYCPGCGHGHVHRILGNVIDELGIRERVLAVAPVGCAVYGYFYWDFDTTEAPHGRAPAVATAMKRLMPDHIVLTYQGDGDLAGIGGNEILHAANRGENITVLFVNNGCYGMTGGQMAPTTPLLQKTTTSPYGRDAKDDGHPIEMCRVLEHLPGVTYLARVTVFTPLDVIKTHMVIREALERQVKGVPGMAFVEILAMCPVGWHVTPHDGLAVAKKIVRDLPVHMFKNRDMRKD